MNDDRNQDIAPDELDRCRRGDVGGLRAVYSAYGDRVYRTALGILGQAADAEDATQEVFLRVLDKAASFDGRARFSTWIYRLTVNHCLNKRRCRRRTPAPLARLDEADLPTCPPAGTAEARDEVETLLGRLRECDRAIVVLREIEELSYVEIAAVLDVPIGTVMSRLCRARERLREIAADVERPGPWPNPGQPAGRGADPQPRAATVSVQRGLRP